jgi:hypothetical protein
LSEIDTVLDSDARNLYKAHTLLSCLYTDILQAVLSMCFTDAQLDNHTVASGKQLMIGYGVFELCQKVWHFPDQLADALNPSSPLLKTGYTPKWTTRHGEAFAAARTLLTTIHDLAVYDPRRPTSFHVYSSRLNGLVFDCPASRTLMLKPSHEPRLTIWPPVMNWVKDCHLFFRENRPANHIVSKFPSFCTLSMIVILNVYLAWLLVAILNLLLILLYAYSSLF